MRTIWKFTLNIAPRQVLQMPHPAEILSVQVEGGHIRLWAAVESDAPPGERVIRVCGTGMPLDDASRFIGTVQHGPFVWHVFEERP